MVKILARAIGEMPALYKCRHFVKGKNAGIFGIVINAGIVDWLYKPLYR